MVPTAFCGFGIRFFALLAYKWFVSVDRVDVSWNSHCFCGIII